MFLKSSKKLIPNNKHIKKKTFTENKIPYVTRVSGIVMKVPNSVLQVLPIRSKWSFNRITSTHL